MAQPDLEQVFTALLSWCRARQFSGHDPFDALNSRLFQATPFRQSHPARLAFTQLVKRSPLDLHYAAGIPAQKNAKGMALFALAALARYRKLKTPEAQQEARHLLEEMLSMRLSGHGAAAWGYNFDWQSRHFFAPKGTPTIVPTAFAARALTEAFESFQDERYLDVARSACEFIQRDLNRTVDSTSEVCFSYSPLDQTRIFNASLLAGETLSRVGVLTGETALCELAVRAARFVVANQNTNGSWPYGADGSQSWIDNFHTAYVLTSLQRIMNCSVEAEAEFADSLRRGFEFWRESFFLADGWPKYYHDTIYPADAHAAATAIVTLVELRESDPGALPLAEKIADWTINNLRDSRGFFYYQRRRFYTIRTPFMRWTQSWMLYALARLLEARDAPTVSTWEHHSS